MTEGLWIIRLCEKFQPVVNQCFQPLLYVEKQRLPRYWQRWLPNDVITYKREVSGVD